MRNGLKHLLGDRAETVQLPPSSEDCDVIRQALKAREAQLLRRVQKHAKGVEGVISEQEHVGGR